MIHCMLLLIEAVAIFIFAQSSSLVGAILVMLLFSISVQAAAGTTFSIVPYVNSAATGSVAGIEGAGGNVGAVAFGLCFRQLDYKPAFFVMGFAVVAASTLIAFIKIEHHAGLFWGQDAPETRRQTIRVPLKTGSAKGAATKQDIDDVEKHAAAIPETQPVSPETEDDAHTSNE